MKPVGIFNNSPSMDVCVVYTNSINFAPNLSDSYVFKELFFKYKTFVKI